MFGVFADAWILVDLKNNKYEKVADKRKNQHLKYFNRPF